MGPTSAWWRQNRQIWAARGALTAAAVAVLLPPAQGGLGGLLLLVVGLAGLGFTCAALWWTLSRRGAARVAAALLALATPVGVVVLFARANLLWVVTVSGLLWCAAVSSGRYALRSTGLRQGRLKEYRTPPPRRPFLLLNPRSGGGKVERFALREKAESLGARVVLLDPEHHQDVAALARRAVADGADLLGVAGGDGTQALVAAVAAEHGLPFLVISAAPATTSRWTSAWTATTPPPASTRSPTASNSAWTCASPTTARSSTTPRSGSTARSCRAPATARTRSARPWNCCPTCSRGSAARA
ncbi:hypothetical protein GCM10020295_74660 [Streptomyces cinereospinus]